MSSVAQEPRSDPPFKGIVVRMGSSRIALVASDREFDPSSERHVDSSVGPSTRVSVTAGLRSHEKFWLCLITVRLRGRW